jgi:hypothetical protein
LLYNINENEFLNGVGIGYTFMGYGNKYSMMYKLLTIGAGTDFNTYWAFLRPFSMNLSKLHIPLIHHLYIGPEIAYSENQDWLAGLDLNLEF